MKAKKKPRGVKHKIREEGKREERIGLAIFIAILIIIIFVSGFVINSMLNQPSTSTSQPVGFASEPKAAIVDQLSLTYPNQTFIQAATNTLEQAGYTVDYYPGKEVTVEFYRNLPTHDYGLIVLRVHSAFSPQYGSAVPFTSEPYDETKYVYDQLNNRLVIVAYSEEEKEKGNTYFGIHPFFATGAMNGRFDNTVIIMMGCNGLQDTQLAEAFVEKGAKVFISWDRKVTASHTDLATTHVLQHFLEEKQTLEEVIGQTMQDVGPDPAYNSSLLYYPLEAGAYTIQNIVGKVITSCAEIQYMELSEKRKILSLQTWI